MNTARALHRSISLLGGLLVAGAASLGGGCATHQVDALQDENRALTEQNTRQANEIRSLRGQLALRDTSDTDAQQLINQQRQQIAQLQDQLGIERDALADFESRLGNVQLMGIDAETSRALVALARQYPDLITYDAQRGMLQFNSDLTFGSGSDQIKPGAQETLQALANILSSGSAANYELMILGHTDAQPIGNPATRQNHPTNMHLACHRAISVRRQLVSLGVPPEKMMAAGWGEHRPVTPNTGTGNTPQNRRVEIYIRPIGTMAGSERATGGSVGVDRDVPPQQPRDFNK
ncbi:MAG: flagellar motor protein MotB [Phycisphaerales bacterium JB039]